MQGNSIAQAGSAIFQLLGAGIALVGTALANASIVVAATLARGYGASLDEVRADISSFTSQLEAAGLLVASATAHGDAARVGVHEPPARWENPVLDAYGDMANLVISDPARVVDEAGWPHLPDPEP